MFTVRLIAANCRVLFIKPLDSYSPCLAFRPERHFRHFAKAICMHEVFVPFVERVEDLVQRPPTPPASTTLPEAPIKPIEPAVATPIAVVHPVKLLILSLPPSRAVSIPDLAVQSDSTDAAGAPRPPSVFLRTS